MLKLAGRIIRGAVCVFKDERGSLDQMVWVIGAAVVVVAVVVLLMVLAPNTISNIWNGFISWVQGQFGF